MLTPILWRILYTPLRFLVCFIATQTLFLYAQINQKNGFAVVEEYTYGGDVADIANCLAPTSDGGHLLAGYTKSLGAGGEDIWLIKTDKNGALLWEKTIGGKKNDAVNAILPLSDGNCILAGYTCSKGAGRSDLWVLKIDPYGNPLWESNFGGADSDAANAITATSDGGFAVAGYYFKEKKAEPLAAINSTEIPINFKKTEKRAQVMWLLKFSHDGILQWNKVFDEWGENSNAIAICETNNGDLVVAGNVITIDKSSEVLVAKVSTIGKLIWSKSYGTNNWDAINSMVAVGKESIVLGGNSFIQKNNSDAWIFKLNGDGDVVWEKKFGSDENETIKKVILNADESLAVATNITATLQQPDLWLLSQFNPKGEVIANTIVGSTKLQQVRNMYTTANGSALIVGISSTLRKCYQRGDRNTWLFVMNKLKY